MTNIYFPWSKIEKRNYDKLKDLPLTISVDADKI